MIFRHHGSPEDYWADSLSDDELSRFWVEGDLAWPAGWELLAILISLHVFRRKSVESRAQIVMQSDSLADLSVAPKLSSSKVLMKAFAIEIALILDEFSAELSSPLLNISRVC